MRPQEGWATTPFTPLITAGAGPPVSSLPLAPVAEAEAPKGDAMAACRLEGAPGAE